MNFQPCVFDPKSGNEKRLVKYPPATLQRARQCFTHRVSRDQREFFAHPSQNQPFTPVRWTTRAIAAVSVDVMGTAVLSILCGHWRDASAANGASSPARGLPLLSG